MTLREDLENSLALEDAKDAKKSAEKHVKHKTLDEAMAAAWSEFRDPVRDQKVDAGKMKFSYADLEGVLKTLRPILGKHGLWIAHRTVIRDGLIILVAQLRHETGEGGEPSEYPVANVNSNHQQIGAGMTYAQRRTDALVTGIASTDDKDTEGTANLGDGPKQKMSAHQARQEVNWEAVQSSIDNAQTLEKLTNIEQRVEANKGIWPDSYVSSANERIIAQRLVVADKKMSDAKDVDALNDVFSDMEAALEGKVPWPELAALHKKHEGRLLG